jgi:hypothetical protein
MAHIDPLSLPFASWQEGLFALAGALSDPEREKIIMARLQATADKNPIGLKEICALAPGTLGTGWRLGSATTALAFRPR